MELLGNRQTSAHGNRALPGRWTPFNNWMSRCALPCSGKCSVDTVSLNSEVAYDGVMTSSSSVHTSRGGYQADVSNLTTTNSNVGGVSAAF